jgi:hypothetical protein
MHEFRADDAFEFRGQPLLDALIEKGRSSCRSFSNAPKVYFSNASANAALSDRSAKAISGSISQNSARWRLVFEFSARKVDRSADLVSERRSALDAGMPLPRRAVSFRCF